MGDTYDAKDAGSLKQSLRARLAGGAGFKGSQQGGEGALGTAEMVLALEALNPTEAPAESDVLAGEWEFLSATAMSPGLVALRSALSAAAGVKGALNMEKFTIKISPNAGAGRKSYTALAEAKFRLLDQATAGVRLETDLSVVSGRRLSENYLKATVMPPAPLPGKGLLNTDAFSAMPDALRQAVASAEEALAKPLDLDLQVLGVDNTRRQMFVTYVDADFLVVRDERGGADVLQRAAEPSLDPASTLPAVCDTLDECELPTSRQTDSGTMPPEMWTPEDDVQPGE